MKLLGGNKIKAAEAEGQPANGLDGGKAGLLTGGGEAPPIQVSLEALAEKIQSFAKDPEEVIKERLRGEGAMQEGLSAPWMSKAGTDEISASAPARDHLDFQLHMMQHLDLLIERLGGRRGITPT